MKASDREIGLCDTNTFKDTEADSAVIVRLARPMSITLQSLSELMN